MILFVEITSTNYLLERSKKCQKKCKMFPLLAWNLLSNICAKLIDFLKNIIISDDFIIRNKRSTKDFTRQRKLPFHILILFLMELEPVPLHLRLIRIELDTGETEILITTLLDENLYPYEIFFELYHDRWPIEEDYKIMKCRIEVENFSGKSVLSIYQDFYAKVFSKNLISALSFPTRQVIYQTNQDKKYDYQINFTQALSKSKGVLVLLFNRSVKKMISLISDLHDIFIKTIEPIRPGRKYPRNHKIQRKCFHLNYKPIC